MPICYISYIRFGGEPVFSRFANVSPTEFGTKLISAVIDSSRLRDCRFIEIKKDAMSGFIINGARVVMNVGDFYSRYGNDIDSVLNSGYFPRCVFDRNESSWTYVVDESGQSMRVHYCSGGPVVTITTLAHFGYDNAGKLWPRISKCLYTSLRSMQVLRER
jgi:hypothetical protein